MNTKVLKVMTKYVIILIFAMFIKVVLSTSIVTNNISYNNIIETIKPLEYKEIDYNDIKIPEFNYQELNDIVSSYLTNNTCNTLEYNIFNLPNNKVSIFLNCSNPITIYYNYETKREFNFNDLIKDKGAFENITRWLLDLKYPHFVTEEVNIDTGVYNIYSNQIIVYFNTQNYGEVSIKINNNEIENLMDYDLTYDEIYENETYTIDKDKKTIAFSYDDGPSNYDLDIIDMLVSSHAKATFFMVGNRMENFKSSIDKMLKYGMEVGNHTYDHKYLKSMNKSQVLDEINKTNRIFNSLTGLNLKIFRPPYGAVNNTNLSGTGLSSILWSVDTLDWKSRNADSVYSIIMEEVKDGDIILMHSLYESTLEATKKVIPELYKQGYQIVSVSELFQIKGKNMEEATSYLSAN